MRMRSKNRQSGRVFITLLTGLLVGGVVGGGAVYLFGGKNTGKGHVPDPSLVKADELALVPADAEGFVHIRLAEGWKDDAMRSLRGIVSTAGPDAVNAIDESFLPSPSTLERLTLVMLRPEAEPARKTPTTAPKKTGGMPAPPLVQLQPRPEPPETVMIMVFSQPVDEKAIVESQALPDAVKKTVNGKEYWLSPRKDGRWETRNGRSIMVEEYRSERAVHFVNDKTLITGSGMGLELYLTKAAVSQGPLTDPLKLATDGTRHVVMAVNLTQDEMKTELRQDLPPEAGPFVGPVLRADALSASLVIGNPAKVEYRAYYKDAATAQEAMDALKEAASKGWSGEGKPILLANGLKGRGGKTGPHLIMDAVDIVPALAGISCLNTIEKSIKEGEFKLEGKELSVALIYPTVGDAVVQVFMMATGLTVPATQARTQQEREAAVNPPVQPRPIPRPPMNIPGPKVVTPKTDAPDNPRPVTPNNKPPSFEDTANRLRSQNNLKMIGLAMHIHHDALGAFPTAAIADEDGKALLSWRVALLPYIEEAALYKEFKLDEPWDSAHNKKLIARMPKVFADPRGKAEAGKTNYKVFVGPANGPSSAFTSNYSKGLKFPTFSDGTSNTILVVEDDDAVEWTKPEDIKFSPMQKVGDLSIGGNENICILMGDGSVQVVKWNDLKPDVRKALITANGNDDLPPDWDK